MKFYTTNYTKNGMGHERDLLGTHSTHAQRINHCPTSILYAGFYNPHAIYQTTNPAENCEKWQQEKRFHYTLHCSFWRQENSHSQGAGKCPLSPTICLGKMTDGSTGLKNLLMPWMYSLTCPRFTATHPILAHREKFCCCSELLLCVFKRFQTRDNGSEGGQQKGEGSGSAGA